MDDRNVPGSMLLPVTRMRGLMILAFGLLGFAVSALGADTNTDMVKLVRELGPSVVAVQAKLEMVRVTPGAGPSEQQGGGSGFVVDRKGRIATNFHVVAAAIQESALAENSLELRPGATILVSFTGKPGEEYQARILGANVDYDLALLELVDASDAPRLDPLPLGDSDLVEAGQEAIAIGAPFGLQSTVTAGIISAIEREQPGLVGLDVPFIQTDVAINPGNSGGPLFNARGEVVGISNAILASPMGPRTFVGVGFAVPINLLKENMETLLAGGLSGVAAEAAGISERPRLGLTAAASVESFPSELQRSLQLPEHGVVVQDVSPGSPADKAGLRGATDAIIVGGQAFPVGGDIIVSVEGRDVERTIHLQQVVLSHGAGDELTLKVWRDGEEYSVPVQLEVVPPIATRER